MSSSGDFFPMKIISFLLSLVLYEGKDVNEFILLSKTVNFNFTDEKNEAYY
jgi:hypothetical protein